MAAGTCPCPRRAPSPSAGWPVTFRPHTGFPRSHSPECHHRLEILTPGVGEIPRVHCSAPVWEALGSLLPPARPQRNHQDGGAGRCRCLLMEEQPCLWRCGRGQVTAAEPQISWSSSAVPKSDMGPLGCKRSVGGATFIPLQSQQRRVKLSQGIPLTSTCEHSGDYAGPTWIVWKHLPSPYHTVTNSGG